MKSLIRNLLAAFGLACVVVGLHAAWPPLAWIVGGLLCTAIAAVWHLRGDGQRERNTI